MVACIHQPDIHTLYRWGWGGGHEMKIIYSGRGIKIKMPLHTLLAWYMVNLTIISSKFEEMSPYC